MAITTKQYEGSAADAVAGSEIIPVNPGTSNLNVQINTIGTDAADATFTLQQTNTPENVSSWIDTPDSTVTIPGGNETAILIVDIQKAGSSYFRWTYTPGTVTAGSISVFINK